MLYIADDHAGSVTTPEPANVSDEALLFLTPVNPRDAWEK